MYKVTPVVTRNLFEPGKYAPINVPQNVATDVFDDITASTKQGTAEIVTRELFNAGPTAVYYSYGRDCVPPSVNPAINAGDFNGIIAVNQMLVVETLQRISVYAAGGSTVICRTHIERHEAVQPPTTVIL